MLLLYNLLNHASSDVIPKVYIVIAVGSPCIVPSNDFIRFAIWLKRLLGVEQPFSINICIVKEYFSVDWIKSICCINIESTGTSLHGILNLFLERVVLWFQLLIYKNFPDISKVTWNKYKAPSACVLSWRTCCFSCLFTISEIILSQVTGCTSWVIFLKSTLSNAFERFRMFFLKHSKCFITKR